MAVKKPKATEASAMTEIMVVTMNEFDAFLLGRTPLLLNRMSEKAKRELIYPRGRLNTAERATNLKHDPHAEFRASVYRTSDPKSPTRLIFPGNAFKKAIASAALDIPGAAKAQVARLTSVPQVNINIYGIPMLHAGIVRMADAKKTPDVRFRAILPEWCCHISVTHANLLTPKNVSNLLGASGQIVGIGDGRTEKGSLDFGQFRMCEEDDPDFVRIMRDQGAAAQDAAMETVSYFDDEAADLCSWFYAERESRQQTSIIRKSVKKQDVDNDALDAEIEAAVAAKAAKAEKPAGNGKRRAR